MAWNEVANTKSESQSEVEFKTLSEGTHAVRILDDEPLTRWTHWLPSANAGKGCSVTCIGKNCPVCELIKQAKKDKVKTSLSSRKTHAINVLDREDGKVKLIDKGNGLFDALIGVREMLMDDVGDITNYDVKIKVTGTGMDTSYVAIPMTAKPLTAEEKALELYNKEEIFKIFTAEQIVKLMAGATFADISDDTNDTEVPDAKAPETPDEKPNVDFTAD